MQLARPALGLLLGSAWMHRVAHPPRLMCASPEGPLLRLDKLLAERGAGSRKDVDKLIRLGAVEIDGEIMAKADGKRKVPWGCTPMIDGIPYAPPPLLVAYHKPVGIFSTMKDERGRPSLSHVLPEGWRKLLHPIGRLDADTSGLLLFSRDGSLTHKLLHPKYDIEREYEAEVEGAVDGALLEEQLRSGVETIEDGEPYVVTGRLLEATVLDPPSSSRVRLCVSEGKYRMVRRVLANCGHPVLTLHRHRYGQVELGDLPESEAVAVEGEALEWAKNFAAAG